MFASCNMNFSFARMIQNMLINPAAFAEGTGQAPPVPFFGEIIDMSAIWFWISKSIAEVIMYIVFVLCAILIALWINKH